MSSISISDAATYTANWREFNTENTVNETSLRQIFPNAYSVDLADIEALMNQEGISKIRIYFGYDEKNPEPQPEGTFPMKVMLVAVNSQGGDIIHTTGPSGIYDHCMPCPSYCDPVSPLSSKRP